MSSWSLEKELCKLAKTQSFRKALHDLGLIHCLDIPFTIRRDENWVRGGAETYIYRFFIQFQDGTEAGYIIKACVAFSFGTSLDRILDEWISRRILISKNGVSTPHLITYGEGVLVEELIPYRLKDKLVDMKGPSKQILVDLAFLTGTLSRLGFAPIDVFNDLRSRGEDVVMIDFGEDLGPARVVKRPKHTLFHSMMNKLSEWDIMLTKEVIVELRSVFLSSLEKHLH